MAECNLGSDPPVRRSWGRRDFRKASLCALARCTFSPPHFNAKERVLFSSSFFRQIQLFAQGHTAFAELRLKPSIWLQRKQGAEFPEKGTQGRPFLLCWEFNLSPFLCFITEASPRNNLDLLE
jgi:hypothetical protein